MMFIIDVESSTSPTSSWILEKKGLLANSFVFLLENIKDEEDKISFHQNKFVKATICIKEERPTTNIAFDTNLSHPVYQRIPSANYMCAQDVHTTHIATNTENIKNNALLYIKT